MLADSPLHPEKPSGGKPKKLFASFHRELITSPLKESITRFASLADELLRTGTLFGEGSTTGTFIPAMKDTPVFAEYLYWFRTGDAKVLRFLHSFLVFAKKAEISDSTLEPSALRKWLEVEERLTNLELDHDIVNDLAYLLKILLPPLPRLPFMGRNGPGTVAGGGRSPSVKLKQLEFDPLLDRAFFLSVGHTAYQERLAHRPEDVIPNYESWLKARRRHQQRRLRPAELLFVPKTVTSMRSICREPAVMMYFQQALRYELEESISSGFLSSFIDIRNQSENQTACAIGSVSGLLDTIDLSSASDSVSLDLVKHIFPRHLLIRMLATRSSRVIIRTENEERTIEVKKFAPMGSAVCFPTQCIIYTAVGIRSMLRWKLGHDWSKAIRSLKDLKAFFHNSVFQKPCYDTRKLQPLRVYGDDILCDSNVTQDIIHSLHLLGFQVNEDKSFRDSMAVRESCGLYAWCGEDISPLRFKVSFFRAKIEMRAVASLVDFANLAGDYDYRHLQSCIINFLLRCPIEGLSGSAQSGRRRNPIKFTSNRDEFGIYSNSPRNDHLQSRYYGTCEDLSSTCCRFQRDEVKSIVLRVPVRTYDDYLRHRYEYTQWWRSAYHGTDSTDLDRRVSWHECVYRGSMIKWGWTPI